MARGFFGVLFSKRSNQRERVRYLLCFGHFAPNYRDASDPALVFAVKEVLREKATRFINYVDEYQRCIHYRSCSIRDLNMKMEEMRFLKNDFTDAIVIAREFHPEQIRGYDSIFSTAPAKLRCLFSASEFLEEISLITFF